MPCEDSQIWWKNTAGFVNRFLINVLPLYFESCNWQCQLLSAGINVIINMYFIYLLEMSVSQTILCLVVMLLVKNEFEIVWKEGIMP